MNKPKFIVGDIINYFGQELEVIRIFNSVCWWEATNIPSDPWFMECRYINITKENLISIQVSSYGCQFELISRPTLVRKNILIHTLQAQQISAQIWRNYRLFMWPLFGIGCKANSFYNTCLDYSEGRGPAIVSDTPQQLIYI